MGFINKQHTSIEKDIINDKRESLTNESQDLIHLAYDHYSKGNYNETLNLCDQIYLIEAYRLDNLLLLGATHFQLRNYSESIFYNQQCIRLDLNFAEAYGNLGNALKELNDPDGAIQFYLRSIKLKPRFADAYNNLATCYMEIGQIDQSIETYRMALLIQPNLIEAHNNLGNLYKSQGMIHESKECFKKCIQLSNDFAIGWNNLGNIYKDENDLDKAIVHYEEAIRLKPNFADPYCNLGNVIKIKGDLNKAYELYKKAIELRPHFAIAYGNLASYYYDTNQIELSIKTYYYAIELEPNYPDAYNNLGNLFSELKDKYNINESIDLYRKALCLKTDHPYAYNNLGNALKDKHLIKEAIHCYMTAIRLMPECSIAHNNIASLFKEQGKIEQSLSHYIEAIRLNPLFSEAYNNMGNTYKDINYIEEAIQCYTTAIRLKPNVAESYYYLACTYKDNNKIEDAITCFRKALSLKSYYPEAFANYFHSLVIICDWRTRTNDYNMLYEYITKQLNSINNNNNNTILPCIQPFHALIYPLSMEIVLNISKIYAENVLNNTKLIDFPIDNHIKYNINKTDNKLRIGYVSSDFNNHPISHLIQNIFTYHNKSKFIIYCYALTSNDLSIYRKNIEKQVDFMKDVSNMSNEDIIKLIYNDGIHILINLNGYTKGNKNEIFALRPAPIQLSYLGFPGTLGANYIQYIIADNIIIPKENQKYYTEKIIYMPHCYLVNDYKQSSKDILNIDLCPSRNLYNIPEDTFVFCNFNQLYKIDPTIFKIWINILKRVPNSILWLIRFPLLSENNLLIEAKETYHLIDAEKRIYFTDVLPKEEHLKRGYLADLFLDTPEYNAQTTGCDILWSGTPMITLIKDRLVSRIGATLLHSIHLKELITYTYEEYEELAVHLALDMNKLWDIRKKLEINRLECPLFDTKRWVENLETSFHIIWDHYEKGNEPDHVYVPDIKEFQSLTINNNNNNHTLSNHKHNNDKNIIKNKNKNKNKINDPSDILSFDLENDILQNDNIIDNTINNDNDNDNNINNNMDHEIDIDQD